MILVERHRAEPALKQMADLARAGVGEAGIEAALPRQRQRQAGVNPLKRKPFIRLRRSPKKQRRSKVRAERLGFL